MSPAHRPDQHPDVARSPEPSARSTSPTYPAGSGATAALVVTALLVLTQLYAAILNPKIDSGVPLRRAPLPAAAGSSFTPAASE